MAKEIQVHSYGQNRKVGDVIEVRKNGGGIVAVGKVVAITTALGGAVTLLVKILAGG